MSTASDFQTKVIKTVTNMDRLDGIVNGDVNTVVNTDNGPVPSLARVLADVSNLTSDLQVATWAELVLKTPQYVGQKATVAAADTGTHTGRTAESPNSNVTNVKNAGVYGGYALVIGAWRRDSDNALTADDVADIVDGIQDKIDDLDAKGTADKAVLQDLIDQVQQDMVDAQQLIEDNRVIAQDAINDANQAIADAKAAADAALADANTRIDDAQQAIVDAKAQSDAAIADANTKIDTARTNLEDAIEALGTTVTDNYSAQTTLIDGLRTDVNGNTATIGTVQTAMSDLVSSTATQIDGLITRVGTTEGSIVDLETSITTLSGSTAEAITQLKAQGTLFAAYKSWQFDTTVEGFTGTSATVTFSTGTLSVAASSTTAAINSPTISVSGSLYDRVRARIKLTSSSGTWLGRLYYSTSAHGYTETYAKDILAPTTSSDWTVLEWDMSTVSNWTSSTITGIRAVFWNGVGDVYLVDWLSIGRQSVSIDGETINTISSSITTAQTAIIDLNANKASTSDLTALASRVGTAESGIVTLNSTVADLNANKAAASALTALTSRVSTTESGISTLNSTVADLNANKASALSVTELTTRVTNAEGSIVTLSNSVSDLSGTTAAQISQIKAYATPFAAYVTAEFTTTTDSFGVIRGTGSVTSSVLTITATSANPYIQRGSLTIDGSIYNKVRARIRKTAGSSGWYGRLYYAASGNSLGSYIVTSEPSTPTDWTIIEWDLSSVSGWTGITVATLRLDFWSASDSVVDVDWVSIGKYGIGTSDSTVNTLSASLTTAQTAIADIQTNKASTSDLTALASRVGTAESGIVTLNSTVADLSANKAAASALTALTSRVSTTESGISTLNSTVADLNTSTAAQYSVIQAYAVPLNAYKYWGISSSVDGWTGANGTVSFVNGSPGYLRMTASASSNAIAISSGLSIPGNRCDRVRIRTRLRSGATTWTGRMQYTNGSHAFSNSYYTAVTAPSDPYNWTILEFDMNTLTVGDSSDWLTGTITGLRFFLWSAADAVWEVDWIAVGSVGVALDGTTLSDMTANITSNSSAILDLQNTRATVTDLTALATRVGTTEGDITVLNTSVSTLTTNTNTSMVDLQSQINAPFVSNKSWQFAGKGNNWTAGAASYTTTTQYIHVTATAAVNNLTSPTISIDGVNSRKARAYIRRVSGSGTWQGLFMWSTASHGFSSTYSASANIPSTPSNWSVVEWDLVIGDWLNNTITGIRLYLWGNGDVFDVQWVAIGSQVIAANATAVELLTTTVDANYSSTSTRLDTLEATVTTTNKSSALITYMDAADASLSSAIASSASALKAYTTPFAAIVTTEFASTTEGFTAVRGTSSIASSVYTLTATSTNPYIQKGGMSIDGSVYDKVRARIRKTAGSSGWYGRLYYAASGSSLGSYVTISEPSVPSDWTIVEWDLSSVSGWTGITVATLRLDFWSASNSVVDIDWVAIGKHAVGTVSSGVSITAAASADSVSGATALWDLAVKVDSANYTASGGITLGVIGTGSTAYSVLYLSADKTYIRNGNSTKSAWLISGTDTYLNGDLIASGTITAAMIVSGTITATQLASSSVTTAKIAANAITAAKIAANAITATQIAANTITADEITIGGVTTSSLAANAVTNVASSTGATKYMTSSDGYSVITTTSITRTASTSAIVNLDFGQYFVRGALTTSATAVTFSLRRTNSGTTTVLRTFSVIDGMYGDYMQFIATYSGVQRAAKTYSFTYVDTDSLSGTTTYDMRATAVSQDVILFSTNVTVTEFKR